MKKIVSLLGFLSCAAGSGFSQGIINFNNFGLIAGNPPENRVAQFRVEFVVDQSTGQ